MCKREALLFSAFLLFLGIVIGFLCSPAKNGISIGNNCGNNNANNSGNNSANDNGNNNGFKNACNGKDSGCRDEVYDSKNKDDIPF